MHATLLYKAAPDFHTSGLQKYYYCRFSLPIQVALRFSVKFEHGRGGSKKPNPDAVDKSHFTVSRILGRGGFGVVRASIKRSDPGKGKYFAIKELEKKCDHKENAYHSYSRSFVFLPTLKTRSYERTLRVHRLRVLLPGNGLRYGRRFEVSYEPRDAPEQKGFKKDQRLNRRPHSPRSP